MSKKIAIIGSGVSGMGAAYALDQAGHDISVFEANDYIGGHSRTIEINDNGTQVPVDSGFIVFNYPNYPHLTALFKHLDVQIEKSDMSFGVDISKGWLEYSSEAAILPCNLLKPPYLRMLWDILKFNRKAPKYLTDDRDVTLGQCMDECRMGPWFREYYMKAMGAAIWSTPALKIEDFPAKTFIRFFQNHGLLTIKDVLQWYTVTGGSREYIKKLTADYKDKIYLNSPVTNVKKIENGVQVTINNNETQIFDEVVFTCHADTALAMLDNPTTQQQEILGAFKYQNNHIIVHHDESFMPSNKKCWASWVYLASKENDEKDVSLTYWMNNLQNFETKQPVLITLNPQNKPDESKILDEYDFEHPIFDQGAIDAQNKIQDIQSVENMWFCGAYQRYGFHEDGLLSSVRVVEKMGVKLPWA